MKDKIYNKEGKELITLAEAEEFGFAKADTLKMRVHAGTLKGIKRGRDWFVVKEDDRKR